MRARTTGLLAWGLWGVSLALVVAAAALAPAAFFGLFGPARNAGDFGGVIALVGLAFASVGAVLGARRPRNPIGWLFLAWGLVMSHIAFTASYTLPISSGMRPGAAWVAWGAASMWHPAFALLVFVLLLFPYGRLPSPRWRPLAIAAVLAYAVLAVAGAVSPDTVEFYFPDLRSPLDVSGGEAATAVFEILLGAQLLLVAAAMVSQVVRLRRARGRERQQIMLFVYAVVVAVALFIAGIIVLGAGYLFPVFGAIPVAAGYAILRHRLYDIDRLVSRTVSYTLVVGALVVVYAGAVLLVGSLLPGQSDVAVAAATLLVAALFNPLRQRVRERVDRRFNRARYNAQVEVDAFGARLRDQLDLDELTDGLLSVVATTIQPATASVWIRGGEQ